MHCRARRAGAAGQPVLDRLGDLTTVAYDRPGTGAGRGWPVW
ncbi:hypothetical protein [Actinoplanes teichomyceticus]|nr:hypothetical protein [Actinoplanes teichomyceticus]